MPDRDNVIKALERCSEGEDRDCDMCEYTGEFACQLELIRDALELLKEQDAVVNQWTKEIADNQLAHAPDELDRENWDYKKGIWDGLQIAWNIISEGR